MKHLITFLCSLMFLGFGFSQTTKIAEWTFETPGGYTTSIPEFTDGNLNYFTRSDGSDILLGIPSFNNIQGSYFFGAHNVDDEPDNGNLPVFFYIDDVNISGYTNLEFRVHLAEDDDGANEDWDNTFSHDYVHFDYDIDNSGTYSNLLWIETTTQLLGNQPPLIDTDFNGVGDGTEITDTFTQFTQLIAGTGSLLDIQIEISLNLSQEDIAIDNIEIWGDPPAAPEIDWGNLQYPPSTTINFGETFDVYGRVYEPGVTDTPASQGAGISAWIGFSKIDATSTNDFTTNDWTWIPANYNAFCPDCNDPTNTVENNDEYFVDIGPYIPGSGTYYYVTRFQFNGGPYSYGGYTAPIAPSPSGGGFWDGVTNVSQILTVNSNCTSPQVTWNGTWTGTPDITTEVIISADYDMTTMASFSACSLTVDLGATLTIDNNKYVEVNNAIVNNGNIIVRSQGSVIQHNNSSTVSGTATIEKTTAILNNWFEYTYWSSPVSNETIENGLAESDSDRRFWFNANNFVDSQMETNNDNVFVSGQDDIDDDANDWQHANGNMIPGVGYAATHDLIGFLGPGNQYQYTFNGTFNNGRIDVPVVRNDAETNDINWNFIGNPYPSAIDVDEFFDLNVYNASLNPNGTLGGAIYLWSQNSPPSDNNNGNESLNFANSDYAIINGSGENPGGDVVTPNRFIPSGQGFFVDFSDDYPATSGNVVFNNTMRVSGNNDQFFRMNNDSESNKLSIKLTSDNGVFNQILVAYIEGATNEYDGMYFDAPRNLSSENATILYSTIDGESRKFAIQGKAPESLTNDEVIPIGIKNNIAIDTQFSLSIANLEGNFLNNNTIYLKDNYLNIEHNLSDSIYTFSLDVGEFNDRFEIRFSNTLSNDQFDLDYDQMVIHYNSNNELVISTTQDSHIANVQVFDLLGRKLIDSDYYNQTLVKFQFYSFRNSVLIINVRLKDGRVLSQKFLTTD